MFVFDGGWKEQYRINSEAPKNPESCQYCAQIDRWRNRETDTETLFLTPPLVPQGALCRSWPVAKCQAAVKPYLLQRSLVGSISRELMSYISETGSSPLAFNRREARESTRERCVLGREEAESPTASVIRICSQAAKLDKSFFVGKQVELDSRTTATNTSLDTTIAVYTLLIPVYTLKILVYKPQISVNTP